MKRLKIIKISLFLAKIWATIVALFLAFFIIAHLIEGDEMKLSDLEPIFIFFPLLVMFAYAMVFYKATIGGILSIIGFAVLFVHNPSLIDQPLFMLILVPPSLLLIVFNYIYFNMTSKK